MACHGLNAYLAAFGEVVDPCAVSTSSETGQSPWVLASQQQGQASTRCDLSHPLPALLVLLGSAVLWTVDLVAVTWHRLAASGGPAPRILVVGGVGHSTHLLYTALRTTERYAAAGLGLPPDRHAAEPGADPRVPEASLFAKILTNVGAVPSSAIRVEDQSTNCGQNAELAVPIIKEMLADTQQPSGSSGSVASGGCDLDRSPTSVARPVIWLFQDPTMQRRTLLSFSLHARRVFAGRSTPLFMGCSPPFETPPQYPLTHTRDRYLSLLLGEVPRLRDDEQGYGPRGRGFIDSNGPIPDEVLAAHAELAAASPAALGR
jgi:hypothetical protein